MTGCCVAEIKRSAASHFAEQYAGVQLRSTMLIVQVNVDAPVALALLLDFADADRADRAVERDVREHEGHRRADQREILVQLDQARESLALEDGNPAFKRVELCYANLFRMWAEV